MNTVQSFSSFLLLTIKDKTQKTAQGTDIPDDLFYNKLSVTLQALRHLEETDRKSQLRGHHQNNEQQMCNETHDGRFGRR